MRNNRKGSLNISINAIVIIVLAMTFLGLGLTFVRNMFGSITETTFSVQDQIKQQILDDLRTGDKKLSFPTNEIKMRVQESKVIAIGVKNTQAQELTFTIEIEEDGSGLTSGTEGGSGTFIWDSTDQTLAVNQAQVYPIKFNSGSSTGTYIIKIVVEDSEGNEYASKSFFITIS